MAFNVTFNAINVQSLHTTSNIAVGENCQFGWSAHSKRVQGNPGWGTSVNTNILNLIYDNDAIDSPMTDPDVYIGATNQQL
ncbi:MAG TPA: hypothetical protein VFV52_10295 [Bacilli bacterium]|nr:hypothetical protein [Bacilli bacterium]